MSDEVMHDLAERLVSDLDAIDQARHMAVYERDARLVARAYLSLAARITVLEEALGAIQAVAVMSQNHHAVEHRLDWLREIESRAREALLS